MVFAIKPVYRLEIQQEYNAAALVLNTPHFEWSGGGGVTYPTDADVLALGNAWKETFRPIQTASHAYTGYKATQVAGDGVAYDPVNCRQIGGDAHEVAATGTLVGGHGEPVVPPHVSLVVSFRTGLVGKSRHGRQYIAGMPLAQAGQGVWTAVVLTPLNVALTGFLDVYGAGGSSPDWTLVIFSRVIASGCKADPNTRHHPLVHLVAGDQANCAKHVTQFAVDTVIRSTRTRELGKGA